MPDSSVVCLGSMMPSALASVWDTAVVGDTGATVAIIGEPIEFAGVRISMEKGTLTDSYFMDQSEAIARFLTQHDMHV